MGKVGGYLEVGRREHGMRPVDERLRDYRDLTLPLDAGEQRVQAGRCMYCGVAFCQTGACFGSARMSGCPLHNLIPEWNDLLWRGLYAEAAERLALTNPLPEFTGRVCPATCEAACNLGLHDDPMTIRDDERAISDWLWDRGGPAPLAPAPAGAAHVSVIGSGPSGLACAWELARRGLRVSVIERADRPGGLLMYGIPNMKLPKEVVGRRIALMRQSGIEFCTGVDAADPAVAERIARESDAVVIAAGTGRARTLSVPGAEKDGVVLAVPYLSAQTRALLDAGVVGGAEAGADAGAGGADVSLPPAMDARDKDVVVVGGGDTGTDCVATALRQGARSVMQLEFLPMPPEKPLPTNAWPEWPNVKKTDYGQVEAIETSGADRRLWATNTTEVLGEKSVRAIRVVSLDWSDGKPVPIPESEREIECQLVIQAMGFVGPDLSLLEAYGMTVPAGGRPLPTLCAGTHRAQVADEGADSGATPVYCAGDTRTGASIVASAISDGLACAAEVAGDVMR